MQVKLLNITPNAEEHIVEIARVSSSRKDKKTNATGLLKYLVRHKHWSPFEHSHATFEIETSSKMLFRVTHELYNDLLEAGVAREQARMILPLATTTKIQMTGSIRSWIHFLELRDDSHAQKEIQLISKEIKQQLKSNLPIISEALNF